MDRKTILFETELYIDDNITNIVDNITISGKTHLALIEGCRISFGFDYMFSMDVVFRTGDSPR